MSWGAYKHVLGIMHYVVGNVTWWYQSEVACDYSLLLRLVEGLACTALSGNDCNWCRWNGCVAIDIDRWHLGLTVWLLSIGRVRWSDGSRWCAFGRLSNVGILILTYALALR